MNLLDYRKSQNISREHAAQTLGVSLACYRFWEVRYRVPSSDNMVKIYEWSDGAVTPNDFYDLPVLDGGAMPDRPGQNAVEDVEHPQPRRNERTRHTHEPSANGLAGRTRAQGDVLPGQMCLVELAGGVS